VSGPIYRLTVRALLYQRRTVALALLALAPVFAALVFALAAPADAHPRQFYSDVSQKLFVPVVTALVSLIVGVSSIGDEREDGTILYLAATPISRLQIVATKVAAAWTASMALLAPSMILTGVLALGGGASVGLILWPLLGVALAAGAYCAASAWLALRVRRPIVIGVLYILLWEGSVATYAASADRLSIAAYGRAVVAERLPQAAASVVSPGIAVIVLLCAAAGGTLLAARRMTRTELP
jgi:ABC-2 type transport system permease protein